MLSHFTLYIQIYIHTRTLYENYKVSKFKASRHVKCKRKIALKNIQVFFFNWHRYPPLHFSHFLQLETTSILEQRSTKHGRSNPINRTGTRGNNKTETPYCLAFGPLKRIIQTIHNGYCFLYDDFESVITNSHIN